MVQRSVSGTISISCNANLNAVNVNFKLQDLVTQRTKYSRNEQSAHLADRLGGWP